MKILHTITLTCAVLLGGCTTFGNALITALATTSGLASEWAVQAYPERRVAFDVAEKSLTIYLAEDTLTIEKLITILQAAGLDEKGWAGPTGDLYIKSGLIVWQLAGSVNHVIANNKYVMLFGNEIRDGFRRGLAKAGTTTTVGNRVVAGFSGSPSPSTVSYQPREHLGKRVVH